MRIVPGKVFGQRYEPQITFIRLRDTDMLVVHPQPDDHWTGEMVMRCRALLAAALKIDPERIAVLPAGAKLSVVRKEKI